jgi:ribosome-binding protein aMBF1 (putative translation factor)
MSNKSIKQLFQESFDSINDADRMDMEASLLAMKFLSIIDGQMAELGMTKKDLAKSVNTSPAFITQLFLGDRKPNWTMLVKMANALNINFNVLSDEQINERLNVAIYEYHKNWSRSIDFQLSQNQEVDARFVLAVVEETDYALAG